MSRLYPCVYCTEDGYCKKYSDDEVTSWCVQGPCKDEKPSNADRIRSMKDEELAKFIASQRTDCYHCPVVVCVDACEVSWLDWLKQEVTDEDKSEKETSDSR